MNISCCFMVIVLGVSTVNAYPEQDRDTLVVELQNPENFQKKLGDAFQQKRLKSLTVNFQANTNQWIVFGTFPARPDIENEPSYDFKLKLGSLPDEFAGMNRLETLTISFLGLDSLPESITQLPVLLELDISFNKLNFRSEVKKIMRLDKLKILKAYGCGVSEEDVHRLQKVNPTLKILYTKQHFFYEKEVSFDHE